MPLIPLNQVPAAPGVYPIINLEGQFSTELPNAGRCYLLCFATAGPKKIPTRITSLTDFLSVFDITPATPTTHLLTRDAIASFFDTTGTIGELYIVRLDTTEIVFTNHPIAKYIDGLNAFDAERDSHGYVVCPEAYALKITADRLAFQVAAEAFVSQFDFQWVAIADSVPNAEFYAATPTTFNGRTIVPSAPSLVITTVAPALASATNSTISAFYIAEAATYASAAGHSSYIANWGVNTANRLVAPSVLQVAVAQVRYYLDGFRCAPAGVKAPCKGLIAVASDFNKTLQSALNEGSVNITRKLATYGVCVMGARTLNRADSAWRFMHVRVIFNILSAYLRSAYQSQVFDPIDGVGVAFQIAKSTATQICNRFWQAGTLYGQTPKQAYFVRCDATNNPAFDLELGKLRVDVYAAPCGVSERILVGIYRTPIGQVPTA